MDFQKLEELMDHFTSWRIPGCACAAYYRHKPVFKYSSGYADVEKGVKMDCDRHKMFMYSCSKPVTCTAALMLWEQGKFLFTDSIGDYMPAWKNVRVRAKDADGADITVPAEKSITVRDLFTMTSGLDYSTNGEAFRAAQEKYSPQCSTVDMMNALAGDPLFRQPGGGWYYGMSHDVLGALVEVISGMSLRDYAKKYIFDPLGMDDTEYCDGTIKESDRAATLYCFSDEEGKYFRNGGQRNDMIFGTEYASGGAGIASTVTDMAKFAEMLANGGKTPDGEHIIGRRTIDLMRRDALREDQKADYWFPGYGYGLGVRTLVDPTAAGATSAPGEFGWTGAAGAYMLVDPDSQVALYYAHHMLNNQEPYTAPRLRNTLYACLED